jgi:hypothetical protein
VLQVLIRLSMRGARMSDRTEAYVRSLRTLIRQFEELQLLRDQVRMAELKADLDFRSSPISRHYRRSSAVANGHFRHAIKTSFLTGWREICR